MSSVLQTIRQQMDGFSKGQKRIAEYILSDYDKAAFMTAAKLGKTAQVSESTVVRFASELGYSGYPAMQKALQELIRGRLTSVQRIRASEMEEGDLLSRAMHRDVETINATVESIDRAAFTSVVEKLLAAEHVYIVGVRSSAFLAGYLNFYLLVDLACGRVLHQDHIVHQKPQVEVEVARQKGTGADTYNIHMLGSQ